MRIAIKTPNKASFFRMANLLKKVHNVDWSSYNDDEQAYREGRDYKEKLAITKDYTANLSFCDTDFFVSRGFTIITEESYINMYCGAIFLTDIKKIVGNIYRCKYKNEDKVLVAYCNIDSDSIECMGIRKNNKIYAAKLIDNGSGI